MHSASRLLGGLVVLLVAGSARADDTSSPVRAMSLAEALAYAEAHAPDLRAARARVEAVRTQRDVSQARWYPTVTGAVELFAGTANNSTGSYVPVSGFDNPRVSATAARNASDNAWSPHATSLLGLGARQEVYDFGRISQQSAADALRTDAERISATGVKLVVDEAIEEAYFAVYAAKAVVQAAQSAMARAQVHRDQAKAAVDVGMRRPIDLTRAQAVLDRYELAGIRARGSVTVAQATLAATVGVPDRLLDIAATPPTPSELPSLQAAIEAADRNPELRSVVTLMRAQEKQTQAIARRAAAESLRVGRHLRQRRRGHAVERRARRVRRLLAGRAQLGRRARAVVAASSIRRCARAPTSRARKWRSIASRRRRCSVAWRARFRSRTPRSSSRVMRCPSCNGP